MRNKILIVDDMSLNRDMLVAILEDDYAIIEADGGQKAIEQMEKYHGEIAVVLLDLMMPDMDGFSVLEIMRERSDLENLPVLIISAESKVDVERRCFELGVADFIHKPFDNAIVRNRVKNNVDLFLYRNALEEKVEEQTKTLTKQNELLTEQAEKLQARNVQIIEIMGAVVEFRNLESGEHIHRVKGFTGILAKQAMKDFPEYGLTPEQIDIIMTASVLHDVGKIAIPDGILLKPGRLNDEEFEIMKSHTTKGCEILNNIKGAWDEIYDQASYDVCRHHHERYDGRGYPDHLVGEDIPIAAQLVSIADVYDALVSERVYKKAFSLDEAFDMIVGGKCGMFSPRLLECFRNARSEFETLAREQNEG